MRRTSPAHDVSVKPGHQLGFYALGSLPSDPVSLKGKAGTRFAHFHELLSNSRTVNSLTDDALINIDCIVVDVRLDAATVLHECREAARTRPIICIVDCDQAFDVEYPYGAHVSDLTSIDKLGLL